MKTVVAPAHGLRPLLQGGCQAPVAGQQGAQLGRPGAARAVGQAMARNPWLLVVPCHRVLAADGGAGGFSAHGGVATKARLLALEGAPLKPARGPRALPHTT